MTPCQSTSTDETPERSDGWIAEDMGVDQNTVRARRLELATHEFHGLPEKTIGRNGKSYEYGPRKRLEEEATPPPGLRSLPRSDRRREWRA